MRKSLASGVGVAAAVVAIAGSGSANAVNEYVGLTYAKAAESINQWGKAIIATREGSYLPTDQCMVVGSRRANFLDSSGRNQGGAVLLDINCNDKSAAGGHPGNSAASPEGKKAVALRKSVEYINKDFADSAAEGKASWCEEHVTGCKYNCEQDGTCSAEVKEFLGI